MKSKKRYERLRSLVKEVNRQRKKQAKKIDILCNDFIATQKNFIKKLDTIIFTANFYKSIIGVSDINALLHIAGGLIKAELNCTNIAFFLVKDGSFKLYMPGGEKSDDFSEHYLESHFTEELVNDIVEQNRICSLQDLLMMGFQASPAQLGKISCFTAPLGEANRCFGFILIYDSDKNVATEQHINHIATIAPGLSRAIISSQQIPSHSAD